MDLLLEFIFELIFEGSMEISSNKKISKWIRYPLIFILILFFVSVIFLLFLAGYLSLKKNFVCGLFLILVGIFLLIGSFLKFKKIYFSRKK